MKKPFLLFFFLVCLFSGCKKDVKNSPAIYVEPADIVFNAKMGEIITFKIKASSPEGLNKLTITYKEPNTFTQTLVDSSLSGNENFFWNYELKIPAKSNAYTSDIGFTCVDNSGYDFTAGRRINVSVSNVLLTEYAGNIFYSKNSGQADSYDLVTRSALYSGLASSALRNLQNDGTYDGGDSLARAWVSPSGSKFVRYNAYDYANANYSTVVNTYEAGLKLDTLRNLQTGDLLFTKVTRNGTDTYHLIKLTSIIDQTGSANDFYIFSLKK